jgi:predicted P-loop ATPase
MNNSNLTGIIICAPQGRGKTSFINDLLKGNKFANFHVPTDKKSHESILSFYDLDCLVFNATKRKDLNEIAKLPNIASVRLPYQVEKQWVTRPLILVETNNEDIIYHPNFEAITLNERTTAASIIFQFILSKTK